MVKSDEEEHVRESSQKQHQLWEDRTLNLLHDSKIDQELSDSKATKKSVWKKHKVKWMKKPMGIPDVILELLEEDIRENALRCLSNFLLEKREEDPENYERSGFLLFHSFGTMTILLQELITATLKMNNGCLNVRDSRRLANVLTLFQSIAANKETRPVFVQSRIPDFIIPIILFESTADDTIDNLRAVSLSVIGILCQARETQVIRWAVESGVVEVCSTIIEIGNELCKVIAMHILESILQDTNGLAYICDPQTEWRLRSLTVRLSDLANTLSLDQSSCARLVFHIIRCYLLLCTHIRGFNCVLETLPHPLIDTSFGEIMDEFPIIKGLHHQLLLSIGQATDTSPLFNQRCSHQSEREMDYRTATSL